MHKIYLAVVFSILVIAPVAMVGSSNTSTEQQDKRDAVQTVRMINTAEMSYARKQGRFATYQELVSAGLVDKSMLPQANDSTQEPLSGFHLKLVVSGDGKAYELSLVQKTGSSRWGLFSSDEGLIYQGQPLQ